jgi:hypothetical protein
MAVDATWQKSRIFIIRVHDQSAALEGIKIFGERQGYTGTITRVSGIDNGIFF